MSTTKAGRRKSEQVLRDMFRRGVLTGHERPVNVWGMESIFMETYARGTSAWRNVFNRVKRDNVNRGRTGKESVIDRIKLFPFRHNY